MDMPTVSAPNPGRFGGKSAGGTVRGEGNGDVAATGWGAAAFAATGAGALEAAGAVGGMTGITVCGACESATTGTETARSGAGTGWAILGADAITAAGFGAAGAGGGGDNSVGGGATVAVGGAGTAAAATAGTGDVDAVAATTVCAGAWARATMSWALVSMQSRIASGAPGCPCWQPVALTSSSPSESGFRAS